MSYVKYTSLILNSSIINNKLIKILYFMELSSKDTVVNKDISNINDHFLSNINKNNLCALIILSPQLSHNRSLLDINKCFPLITCINEFYLEKCTALRLDKSESFPLL